MPRHFHDYNEYYRSIQFGKEVEACSKWMSDELGTSDAIVVVGFTGHYEPATGQGEAIAHAVVEAVNRGVKAFMLHMWKDGWRSYLWKRLYPSKMAYVVDAPHGQTAAELFDFVVCDCPCLMNYINTP
jgi:hypothetical protein